MVQIYHKKWQRGVPASLWGYLRDWFVLFLPVKRLPPFWVKLLYGAEPYQFAFLVHPRAYPDVFISMPVFKPLKFFLRREKGYKFFSDTTPFILNRVVTKQNINGYVIAQLTVPEIIFEERKHTLHMLKKSILLVSKICTPGAVVGLGAWYPMVTKRGELLQQYAEQLGIVITNGHCGTLASIFMSVERIAQVSGMPLDQMNIAVIGVGKMGANVARAFHGKAHRLMLIDINASSLTKIKVELERKNARTQIDCIVSAANNKGALKDILRQCHVGVCATSSYRNILKLRDLPENFIGIDDSRPEALPRDPKKERIVLEGGLLKIQGAQIDYNYGFGEDDNAFGCLGETFLLALDRQKTLKPTLGDVDMENFSNMLSFCKNNGVCQGDFKSSHFSISDDDIKIAIEAKRRRVTSL